MLHSWQLRRLHATYCRLSWRIGRQKHGDRRLHQQLELHRWQGRLVRVIPGSAAAAAMIAKTLQVSHCCDKMPDDTHNKDVHHSSTSITNVLMSCVLLEDFGQSLANPANHSSVDLASAPAPPLADMEPYVVIVGGRPHRQGWRRGAD